jgi:5-formyltetrahydrofolate cyclo-ligase
MHFRRLEWQSEEKEKELREHLKKQENNDKVLAFFKFTPFCGMQEILAVFAKMHSETFMPVARKNYFKTFLVVCKFLSRL